MRIGIIGTGAIGGYFGGKLALAGNDVAFLARGKNLEALKKNGLQLQTGGKIYTTKNAIFTDKPEELGSLDYILFTVKSYDTEVTALQIKPIIQDKTVIITPQNGIENDRILGSIFGKEKIIPGMAMIGVNVSAPGFIEHEGLGTLKIGEYDGAISERLGVIEKICKDAGIDCVVSANIQLDRWKKFIWNCTFNIIAAITGLSLDKVLDNPHLRQLCVDTIHEIQKVAQADGIDFGAEDVVAVRVALAEKLGAYKPSTLEDLEKGKRLEIDTFTGTVIKFGKEHNVSTPINNVFYALLDGIAKKNV